MSDRNPHDPTTPAAGRTMVAVPRLELTSSEGAPSEAPRPFSFGSMAMPPPVRAAAESGATMVGLGRVSVPPQPPGTAATMIGMRALSPAHAPETGGTMVGLPIVPPPLRESGATMVGLPVVPPPARAHVPETGATMVGMPVVAAAPVRLAGPPPAYEIIRHLGGGELGQVFHARHRVGGQEVALRIIRPDLASVPGAADALRDVAALGRTVVHANIGKILDFDETASDTLVLEYVPGKQLSSLMQERGAAPSAAVIDLGIRLASALAAAHGAGLAHGRVHAGNVVLEAKSGRWALLDMGHGYCVQGLEPSHDLYALGALLYQMGTGNDPFAHETVLDPRVYAPKLPAGLSALLMRTLAPDPSLWFGSAIELAQALARAKSQP